MVAMEGSRIGVQFKWTNGRSGRSGLEWTKTAEEIRREGKVAPRQAGIFEMLRLYGRWFRLGHTCWTALTNSRPRAA